MRISVRVELVVATAVEVEVTGTPVVDTAAEVVVEAVEGAVVVVELTVGEQPATSEANARRRTV
jgi:hypothetical protein